MNTNKERTAAPAVRGRASIKFITMLRTGRVLGGDGGTNEPCSSHYREYSDQQKRNITPPTAHKEKEKR
jgi:hypothetical protein